MDGIGGGFGAYGLVYWRFFFPDSFSISSRGPERDLNSAQCVFGAAGLPSWLRAYEGPAYSVAGACY